MTIPCEDCIKLALCLHNLVIYSGIEMKEQGYGIFVKEVNCNIVDDFLKHYREGSYSKYGVLYFETRKFLFKQFKLLGDKYANNERYEKSV